MTNEEIRIAIAKAKGWRFGEFHSTPENPPARAEYDVLLAPGDEWNEYWTFKPHENWPDRFYIHGGGQVPNWPENIADAMELWEEFDGNPGLMRFPVGLDGRINYGCFFSAITGYGATAPLAICAAWLAWKASA